MSSSVTEFPVLPTHGYRGEPPTPPPVTRPRGLTVAISREAGARGTTIARKVAELLKWQTFDLETLEYLVQDETARARFLADIPETAQVWAANHLEKLKSQNRVTADADTTVMIQLILAAAARGDAVIVGRGAGFLLPVETTIHVRVVAPIESRIAYFAEGSRLSRAEASAEVRARDEKRAQFLISTYGRDPADATAYDVMVNATRLGIEGAAQFIGWAVRTKQMFAEIKEQDKIPHSGIALDDLPV